MPLTAHGVAGLAEAPQVGHRPYPQLAVPGSRKLKQTNKQKWPWPVAQFQVCPTWEKVTVNSVSPPPQYTHSHILRAIGNYRTCLSNLGGISRKPRSLPSHSLPWGPVELLNTGHNSTDHLWDLYGSPPPTILSPCPVGYKTWYLALECPLSQHTHTHQTLQEQDTHGLAGPPRQPL